MSLIVYFSSRSENTHRFVQRTGLPAVRIPLNEREHLRVDEPIFSSFPAMAAAAPPARYRVRRSAF